MSPASQWSFLIGQLLKGGRGFLPSAKARGLRRAKPDENTSRTLVTRLRARGYAAEHVYEAGLQGQPDSAVFAYAQARQQAIITADLGFANII